MSWVMSSLTHLGQRTVVGVPQTVQVVSGAPASALGGASGSTSSEAMVRGTKT